MLKSATDLCGTQRVAVPAAALRAMAKSAEKYEALGAKVDDLEQTREEDWRGNWPCHALDRLPVVFFGRVHGEDDRPPGLGQVVAGKEGRLGDCPDGRLDTLCANNRIPVSEAIVDVAKEVAKSTREEEGDLMVKAAVVANNGVMPEGKEGNVALEHIMPWVIMSG